ncbi:MAG: NAD-dependent epimerase/dehydratase family protein [Myxococcales bacterium]|nr:NAD-dependent epimerase/dehydratase family protein [Myxococcales bacterium]
MSASQRIDGSTVVVTGGCGFIGSHLVGALARRGAKRVVVIDSLRYGKRENLPAGVDVEVVQHDLGFGDEAELERACAGADYLFHLAAEKHNQSKDAPTRVLRANVEGTAALFQAAGRAGVKKVLLTSSLYAYGRLAGPPMVESETPNPSTVYGISKLTGEHLLSFFAKQHGMDAVTLRYFFVYGPRQFAGTGYKSVIVKSFEHLRAGRAPVIYGDGLQALDYVYVDDAVEATLCALEAPLSGELFNVGSGVATSVKDLIELMVRVSGQARVPESAPADWTHGSSRAGNVDKIAKLLGWRATTSLEQGLAATHAWLAETG